MLAVTVGNTVHVRQLVGWFPAYPPGSEFPWWMTLWPGLCPTWKGITAQVVAAVAVVDSSFDAGAVKTRPLGARREAWGQRE